VVSHRKSGRMVVEPRGLRPACRRSSKPPLNSPPGVAEGWPFSHGDSCALVCKADEVYRGN
jgi:hypothetical protein